MLMSQQESRIEFRLILASKTMKEARLNGGMKKMTIYL